jgi:DNA-binding IclR family transcriptional regulator
MAEEPLADDRQRRAAELIGRMGEEYLMIEAQADRLHPVDMISAPVFGPDGTVLCTLSLFGFERPLSLSRIAALGDAIGRYCRAAARENQNMVGDVECAR